MMPLPGGLEAVKQIKESGVDVRVCTSPGTLKYAAGEKSRWVHKYLGEEFTKQLVITRDKTVIRGDILIDDKPDILNSQHAEWTQILYDQPYNRHIKDKKRLTWDNWEQVLKLEE